jgi:signal transduction histidine kinase
MPTAGRKLTAGDLEDLRVLSAPEVARRGLHLFWHVAIDGAVGVSATETRQIALNLLLNACEASPPGGQVGFAASVTNGADSASIPELCLRVSDAGPGLPASMVAALNELGTLNPNDPPRGLGIRVVRHLVRSLGGRITATAGERGSSITVSLPTGQPVREEIE